MKKLVGFLGGIRVIAASVALAALSILSISCEKNDIPAYESEISGRVADLNPVSIRDGTVTWFGPEVMKICRKTPIVYKRFLKGKNFENYENFILVVQNGSSGKKKVTRLEILIDSVRVITFADFRRNTNIITVKLEEMTASSEMQVRLYGSRGQYVNVRIECFSKSSALRDIDGNTYKTVTIGDQLWMAENLRTTRFTDGTPISNVTGSTEWVQTVDLNTEAAYCWYDNDTANKNLYGALYNTHAVAMGFINDFPRQLCPAGWHIPSSEDWQKLILFLDPDAIEGANPMSETAGGKLKEAGLLHWSAPNAGATNESGFTALPAGARLDTGPFTGIGETAFFWGDHGFSARHLGHDHTFVMFKETNNAFGYSVRCLKD